MTVGVLNNRTNTVNQRSNFKVIKCQCKFPWTSITLQEMCVRWTIRRPRYWNKTRGILIIVKWQYKFPWTCITLQEMCVCKMDKAPSTILPQKEKYFENEGKNIPHLTFTVIVQWCTRWLISLFFPSFFLSFFHSFLFYRLDTSKICKYLF